MDDKGNRYVAHIDILGMSSIVEKGIDEAWGVLSDLVSVRDKVSAYEIEFLDTSERVVFYENFKMVTFSDTIVVFSKGDSPKELHCMIIMLTEIFHKALCKCVPVRAGLSHGAFYYNFEKSMYAGPALIDAYRIGESAQWLGITLSDAVGQLADKLALKTGESDIVVKWDVPLKTGTHNHYVINWPAIFSHDFNISPPISISQFYEAFIGMFGSFESLPEEVRSKYEHTVAFINNRLVCHNKA